VKTAAACLDELTTDKGKRKLNMAACLKRLWACKAKNIVARKEGKRACTTIIIISLKLT